eukprot:TRINITY_DN10662_c0_g1_i1.p1 TRINITY_DN10662_c0_g1~~TRINITY_DN10662_c0_g1_i1.p1  ORF type:complete len:604 (-),score=125.66 TRINITY_DN10662_c0_g1_i1:157-1923(-)
MPSSSSSSSLSPSVVSEEELELDVLIVGAGFAGLYMLHRIRQLLEGFTVKVFEAGSGIGGTWFWNRYPGARCDIQSLDYSYSFSPELEQEWKWTERYPSQPEILRYIEHVAERFELRRDIRLNTRVETAHYDEKSRRWSVEAIDSSSASSPRHIKVTAKFLVMATGCLSVSRLPSIEGLNEFKGKIYRTSQWPHENVDFTNQRVAVIGTGSSGIQSIPVIAQQAKHLTVFQRTPNFSIPAGNEPLDPEMELRIKSEYRQYRQRAKESTYGVPFVGGRPVPAVADTPEDRVKAFQERWDNLDKQSSVTFLATYPDLLFNKDSNDSASEFVRSKIREKVKDARVAESLCPKDHPIGTKRICIDTHYYETYNRDNVTLVDLRQTPIEKITPNGIRTTNITTNDKEDSKATTATAEGTEYEFDSIVFATGFDAFTGALFSIDLKGKGGVTIKDRWSNGPRTYLGLSVADFPNLFTITGPQSPSVFTNMIPSIEQHVEWIADLLVYMRNQGHVAIEATKEAEDAWVDHSLMIANMSLFPLANSWYMGANIPGKPRVFMPYVAGLNNYSKKCDDVAAKGYEGFVFVSQDQAQQA